MAELPWRQGSKYGAIIEPLISLLRHGIAAGELLPTADCQIDIAWITVDRTAATASFLSRYDQRFRSAGAAEYGICTLGHITNGIGKQRHRFDRRRRCSTSVRCRRVFP